MKEKNKSILVLIIVLIIFCSIFFIYYSINQILVGNNAIENKIASVAPKVEDNKIKETEEVKAFEEKSTATNSSTIFEIHYYNGEKKLKKIEKLVNNSLTNKSEEEILKIFEGYKIESFSPKKVVLSKIEEEIKEEYILGEENGYITIFFKNNSGNKVLETTNISINSLPESDIELLKKGISFDSKNDIYISLESYHN